MFILIWATLLFSVRGGYVDNGISCELGLEVMSTDLATKVVSNHTIIFTVYANDHDNAKYINCNVNVKANKNLKIKINVLNKDEPLKKLLEIVQQPNVIFAFLIGIILSANIICLSRKCHRDKPRSSGNVAEALEMVTTQAVPLMDAGQAEKNDHHDQEAAEGGAEAAGQSAPEGGVEPEEAKYSDIKFSLLKSPTRAEHTQKTADTEYAEIKKEVKEERENNEREDCVMFKGNNEEVMVIKWKDKETKQCMFSEETEGQDMAVYSNVNEIMGEF